jgi:hypothetical protein
VSLVLTSPCGVRLDSYHPYPRAGKLLRRFTLQAMRVDREEPFGSRLETLEYDIREPSCKEYVISLDMSCQAGLNGRS